MEKIDAKLKPFDELRKRAEDLLSQTVEEPQSTGENDVKKLVNAIQVHQIELEIQNDELRRAQLELEESKQRYADLFDYAPVGYLVLDLEGVVLDSNFTGASLLGVERRHLLKKKFSDFIASEFQDVFYFHRKSVSKSRTRQTCKLQLEKKDGTPFYASIESIAKQDADGNFLQINTTVTDIDTLVLAEEALRKAYDSMEEVVEKRTIELVKTNKKLRRELKHRKRTEKALLESEQRYRAVVESQTELICRFLPDGSLTFVNNAYSRCFGKKPAELIGHRFLDQVPQEDLEKVEKHLAAINRENPIATIKHRAKQPDGAIRWQEWIDRAIFDDQGRVKEFQSVGRDITERVKAEQALRRSEQRFRLVADFTYNWEYWIAPDGNYIYVSPSCERITGYHPDEFMRDAGLFQKIIHPDDFALVGRHFNKDLLCRDTKSLDFRIRPRNGKERWIAHICQPVYDDNGQFVGRRASNRDITNRKLVEEALNEAQKDLERRVEERTSELKTAAKKLKTKQKELLRHKAKLELVNKDLLETNRAVSVLARNIDKNRRDAESRFAKTISSKILPLVEDLKKAKTLDSVLLGLDFLTANVQDLSNDLTGKINLLASLTPTELRVASMIKKGQPSRRIADKLCVSWHTIKSHRRNNRKKLNIQNSAINLESYLRSTMW